MLLETRENLAWCFYSDPEGAAKLSDDECGKWMVFFTDAEKASAICEDAVDSGSFAQAKHSSALSVALSRGGRGVMCLYVNGGDAEGQKKAVRFLVRRGLVRKAKSGKLYDMPFKYDWQTRTNAYGRDFYAFLHLSDFVDLSTWEIKEAPDMSGAKAAQEALAKLRA